MTNFHHALKEQTNVLEAAVVAHADASKAAETSTSSSNFFKAANGGKFARLQNVAHLPRVPMGADISSFDEPKPPVPRAA